MQPFALLLVSLPLTAVALCFPPNKGEEKTIEAKEGSSVVVQENRSSEGSLAVQDSQWLHALLLVSSVQIWAFFVAVMLFLISQTNHSAELKLTAWSVLTAVSLKVALGVPEFFSVGLNSSTVSLPSGHDGRTQLWMAVKALTLGVTSIGLAVMSTVNYPVALVGALVLVPICVGVFPLQYIWNDVKNRQGKDILTVSALAVGALMTVLGSPPGLVVWLVWSLGWSFGAPSPANFWYFMESLVSWQSALLPYLLVIHLPVSVLCMYILFSPHRSTLNSI